MVKNRSSYYRCTNEQCKKGKIRAIRKDDWKRNHSCDFEKYAEYAYGYKQRFILVDRKKKKSGKNSELMCTNPECPIKEAGKNYKRIRSNNWDRNHKKYMN